MSPTKNIQKQRGAGWFVYAPTWAPTAIACSVRGNAGLSYLLIRYTQTNCKCSVACVYHTYDCSRNMHEIVGSFYDTHTNMGRSTRALCETAGIMLMPKSPSRDCVYRHMYVYASQHSVETSPRTRWSRTRSGTRTNAGARIRKRLLLFCE